MPFPHSRDAPLAAHASAASAVGCGRRRVRPGCKERWSGFGIPVRIPGVIDRAERVLREVFGLDEFRPGQAEVVAAMLAGRDVLSVAPTGSGKSISYWVPAVVDDGLTIVVSPLIALMKDQVDRLTGRGVAATFINSSVERSEQVDRLRGAIAGNYRMVFLAPERLGRPGFMERLAELRVRRLVEGARGALAVAELRLDGEAGETPADAVPGAAE